MIIEIYERKELLMSRKTTLDIVIIISCFTGIILSYVYLENFIEMIVSLITLGTVGLLFLILAFIDNAKTKSWEKYGYSTGQVGISEILLLGENNNITDTWDIYRKTSIVFGRDEGENQVDINLKNTDYAGTIDREHAVMNYSNGSWYIEDLDSKNGTRIQRNGIDKPYMISSREPCKVEKGDIIYLGLAPFKIR